MTVSSLPDPTSAGGAELRHDANRGQAQMAPSPVIRLTTDSDRAGWDRFVDNDSAGTFFHRYGWANVLQTSFGYETRYLVAEEADAIVGLLPLVHKKSALFGDAVISLPFCSYGGPLSASSAIARTLAEHAVQLTHDLGADYVELRGGVPSDSAWVRTDDIYATFERPIEQSPEAILAAIPRKGRRHALRQSLKAGLSFEVQEDLSDFYRVISESYRNLGTPIFPKHYFDALRKAFPQNISVNVIRQGNEPIAASLAFTYRDHLHPLYAGGTAAARDVNANDFLFYSLMCAALEQGLTRFDFGRSKVGTGSFDYKKYWGFEPRFLTYGQKLVHGKKLPDLSPLNPRYKAIIGAWKHLPLGLSRALGPRLVRHLG